MKANYKIEIKKSVILIIFESIFIILVSIK